MIDLAKHIEMVPGKLYGKPVIANTRVPVGLILEKLAGGDSIEDLLVAYPQVTKADISACLLFAAKAIKNEVFLNQAS